MCRARGECSGQRFAPIVRWTNKSISMKIVIQYLFATTLLLQAFSCSMDDEVVLPEPTLSDQAAIDLIEQTSLQIAADNANWNNIVLDLETELQEGGQFGYQTQIAALREYAEGGQNTGVACISTAMPNWMRSELSAIVQEFNGLEVEDSDPVLCDSNVDGLLTEMSFTEQGKMLTFQGYDLPDEFQLVVNLENDTENTTDNITTAFLERTSNYEFSVNLIIYEFDDLLAYEFLRVYFQGEVVTELIIQ